MASLLQKLRTLFKARLHEAADKALQKSDLAVYDEYIAEPRTRTARVYPNHRPLFAQVKTSRRRREALANEAARFDLAIDTFLQQGKRTEAMVTQKQFMSAMELIKTYDTSLEKQVSALEKLDDVKVKLEGRRNCKQEREEAGFLLQLAKSKEVRPRRCARWIP